jgi:hypothetical protein
MPEGLEIYNQFGELSFTHFGKSFEYLGTATRISTVQPTTTNAGYSDYQFTFSGDYLLFGFQIQQSQNVAGAFLTGSRSGSTWTLRFQFGDGTTNSSGFLNEATTITVRCWGSISTGSSVGMNGYNQWGTLTTDLLKHQLQISGLYTFPTNQTTGTVVAASFRTLPPSSTIYPMALTACSGELYETFSVSQGGGFLVTESTYNYRWYRSGSTIYRTPTLYTKNVYLDDGFVPSSTSVYLPQQSLMCADAFRFVAI